MKPVTVSTEVPRARAEVYAYLDVLANHEAFTDHMMRDWRLSGPATGVGARADVNAVVGRRQEPVAIEVVQATPPSLSVERNVSAGGRRVGTGTYRLAPNADGGCTVTFTYAWERAPLFERLFAPLVRAGMRRSLQTAMTRLAAAFAAHEVP